MSERDWMVSLEPRHERVLRACQGICRTLAEEALLRIGTGAEGLANELPGERRAWLAEEKAKLEGLLDQLGEPL